VSQIRVLRAKWVLPIDRPPLEGGWIEIDRGRITRLGRGAPPSHAEDLGHSAILPGLVNAHTHLELGWLGGRVAPAGCLVDWIRDLVRARGAGSAAGEAGINEAMARGAEEARATGTVLVGDVSNSLATPPVLRAAAMEGIVFHELLGFDVEEPERVVAEAWRRVDELWTDDAAPVIQGSVVAHAPYSVSPALFRAIAGARRHAPLTVHLAESADELEFLMTGRGPLRALLDDFGVWNTQWQAPRCDPLEYLKRLDYLHPGCLVVHGVHLSRSALERLRDEDAVLVTCPRSNEWVGAGMPPLAHFYASGVRVAIGTDSLASVGTLNLFDELAAMRRIAPEVSAASLLESATRIGAEALGRSTEFGTIAAGKRAALVAVRIPERVRDVEECLVSGIGREAISAVGHWPDRIGSHPS
jgi:cytosine/adenosine deaminase-related metal-dependent hydrolase